MKKVLFVATVTKHINTFHIPYLKLFKENGYEVHVASNGEEKIDYCDKHFNLPFERFPIKIKNIKVYKELKKIINENQYDIIHCHTPVGGVLTRLAARKASKKGTRVIYTAHGFHFYKGAPIKNWILYYPIEKICSKWTDTIITINKEDFNLANAKFKGKNTHIYQIPGIGFISPKKENYNKTQIRKEIGLKENDFVLIYPARIDKNKNQILLLKIMKEIKQYHDIKLLLLGKDETNGSFLKIIQKNDIKNVYYLGEKKEVFKYIMTADLGVASSKREGFGMNLVEVLYCGIPVIASDNRGHREIIINGKNGYLVKEDISEFKRSILRLYNDKNTYNEIKSQTKKSIKKFNINNSLNIMKGIYFTNEKEIY